LTVAALALVAESNRLEFLEPLVPDVLEALRTLKPKTLLRVGVQTNVPQPRRVTALDAAPSAEPPVGPDARPYDSRMVMQLTAVFQKAPEGYVGFVEEPPGANTQAATLEEARENLQEVIAMVLQANRELIEETSRGAEVKAGATRST
jgi:predicted RNase H-like HicB family nuclease